VTVAIHIAFTVDRPTEALCGARIIQDENVKVLPTGTHKVCEECRLAFLARRAEALPEDPTR
jgi:hypothetical protein